MPKQYERYILRAEKQKNEGLFDDYYIFIIAPKSYIDSNTEAKKYDNKILPYLLIFIIYLINSGP